MALQDITARAVHQAIEEFDRVGRNGFLSAHGLGKARRYLLIHNGRAYDSKAIAGVAHGYVPGQNTMSAQQFSGGEKAAAGRLRELGFDIQAPEWQVAKVPSYEPGAVYHRVRDIHSI